MKVNDLDRVDIAKNAPRVIKTQAEVTHLGFQDNY